MNICDIVYSKEDVEWEDIAYGELVWAIDKGDANMPPFLMVKCCISEGIDMLMDIRDSCTCYDDIYDFTYNRY